jgi:type IX secretion system PorP/SprF family membrane protein
MLRGGIGLTVFSDQEAAYDNTNINLSYAYQAELGSGQLGIGFSFGMYQSGLDGSQLNPSETGDNRKLYFNTQDVYFGLSSLHLTEPSIDVSDGSIKQLKQHYFLIAGSYHEISSALSLNPSIYLKSDGSSSQLDINTNLLYNDKIWGGLSYRLDDGIVLLAGLELMKDLRLGLAYDLVMSEINTNSFEVMLGYNFDIKVHTQTQSCILT